MPKISLPQTAKGWVLTLIASMVGFVAGVTALAWLGRVFK